MEFQDALKNTLLKKGQLHLLQGAETLSAEAKLAFEKELETLPYALLEWDTQENPLPPLTELRPAAALERKEIAAQQAVFAKAGIAALQKGEIGAVILAGGQGTRLGYPGPKGTCDIGITRPFSIFEALFSNMLDTVRACGCFFPVYVMVSVENEQETKAFLTERHFFGYAPDRVHFFVQETEPCVNFAGNFFLRSPGVLASSPNGNGGWFSSMLQAGLDAVLQADGVRWLNVVAVDNVLQRIADPVFVGATLLSGKACGAKVVRKNAPGERMGVLCARDSHPVIVEYYELPPELAALREEDGELTYRFGVILNYLFSVDRLRRMHQEPMPLHRVEKKIPYLGENGQTLQPDAPNGYKFETLALDLVAKMDSCLAFEVEREREFAPIKNRIGVDSVESARVLLAQNGVLL